MVFHGIHAFIPSGEYMDIHGIMPPRARGYSKDTIRIFHRDVSMMS